MRYPDDMPASSDALALIDAQRAYFASDERIRERAAAWADASPQECLESVREECEAAMQLIAMKPDAEQERALAPEPIPPQTIALLERLQRRPR